MPKIPTLADIKRAQERLKGVAHNTPIKSSRSFSQMCGNDIYFKLENLQLTGAFKIRGAYNKIASLPPGTEGVVAASAGNHAQGVAYSATKRGIKSYIVMSEFAPLVKVQSTRGYGAEVILHGTSYDAAFARAKELAEEKGLTMVHAFDDPDVIAGQGTIGLEILEEMPDTDAIIVPVGGGGLISGVAIAAKSVKPDVKIIGVQARGCSSMYRSLRAGKIVNIDTSNTIADGIAVKNPSEFTFSIIKEYVDKIVTVTDEEINAALLGLLERSKLLAEPAGIAPLAALIHNKAGLKNKKVVCVISGGNIDVSRLSTIIRKGLIKSGREFRFTTRINDRPGELAKLLKLISDKNSNIIFVKHDRLKSPVGVTEVGLRIEVNGKGHIGEIAKTLEGSGYKVKPD